MNKLKTDIDGKFPFVLNDLRWQAQGMKKALANLAKGFGDKVILWGLTSDAAGYHEGAAFINNEIYKFEQTALLSGTLVLKIAETYDENGYKEFPDRADSDKWKNTYLIREIVMKSYKYSPEKLPDDEFFFQEFVRLSDIIDKSVLTENIEANAVQIASNKTNIQNNSTAITNVDAKISGANGEFFIRDGVGNIQTLTIVDGLVKSFTEQ